MTGHDRADNSATAFRGDQAAPRVEQVSINRVYQIALAQRFPIQSISRIEHNLAGVRRTRRPLRGTEDDFHQGFPGGSILG